MFCSFIDFKTFDFLEVNSSPGLEGIETASKINVAEKIIEFLEESIKTRDTSKPIDI